MQGKVSHMRQTGIRKKASLHFFMTKLAATFSAVAQLFSSETFSDDARPPTKSRAAKEASCQRRQGQEARREVSQKSSSHQI